MLFNETQFKNIAETIFLCDSPSGFTSRVIERIKELIKDLGYEYEVTNKGTLIVKVKGNSSSKKVALSAHTDTLGLMVRSIKSNGNLALTKIGGPLTPTLDGEYVNIYTRDSKVYTGTILSTSPASHVYEDASSLSRDIDHLECRIDEKVFNVEDVKKLGIQNGDFVCIDPKFTMTPTGFLKSRFIDDKASVAILIMLLLDIRKNNITLNHDTSFIFSVYEEVGHGASALLEIVDEFIAVDMGCVGKDLSGNEYAVSICAKDSTGPYDYELTTQLINLAKENNIKYTVDIFPMYGSDIGAARSSGYDFKGALIGTGVSASHGMERTHMEGIKNTYALLMKYLLNN